MSLVRNEKPCPCSSGKAFLDCHALKAEKENVAKRLKYFQGQYISTHGIVDTIFKFSIYKRFKDSFDMQLSTDFSFTTQAIKNGLANRLWRIDGNLPDVVRELPIDFPFDRLIFIFSKINFNFDDKYIELNPGLYLARPSGLFERDGKITYTSCRIYISLLNHGSLLVDGEPVELRCDDLPVELLNVDNKIDQIAVRSHVLLGCEILRHPSSF